MTPMKTETRQTTGLESADTGQVAIMDPLSRMEQIMVTLQQQMQQQHQLQARQQRLLDRLDQRFSEEDEGKKQQEERMKATGDSSQILSSIEGFVKSFESTPPVTVSDEKDDLSIQKINSWVSSETAEDGSPVEEKGVDAELCREVTYEENPLTFVGSIFQREDSDEPEVTDKIMVKHEHKVFDQMIDRGKGNSKKKKKRWKVFLEILRLVEKKLGFEQKKRMSMSYGEGVLGGIHFTKGRGRHQLEKGKQISAERDKNVCHMLDEMHITRKKKKKRKLEKHGRICLQNRKDGNHKGCLRGTNMEYEMKKTKHVMMQEKLMQKRKRVLKELGKMEGNGIKHVSQLLGVRSRLGNLRSHRETTEDRSAQNLQGYMTRVLCDNFTLLLKNQHNITKAVKKLERGDSKVKRQEQRYDKTVQISVAEFLYISRMVRAAEKLGGSNQLLVLLLDNRNQSTSMAFMSAKACSYYTDGYLLKERQSSSFSNRVWKPGRLKVHHDKLFGIERTCNGQGSHVKREETISPQILSSQEKDHRGTGRQAWSGSGQRASVVWGHQELTNILERVDANVSVTLESGAHDLRLNVPCGREPNMSFVVYYEAVELRLEDRWGVLQVKIMLGAARKRLLFKISGPFFMQALESLIKHCVSRVKSANRSNFGIEMTQGEALVMKLENIVEVFASLYFWSETVSARKIEESLKRVKLEKIRMEVSEHPSVVVVARDLFHSQRPPEQPLKSWSAGQWSAVGSNCGRRVASGSYDQTKLKLKQLGKLHLSNSLPEEEHKSLYQPVLKDISVVEFVNEAFYFNQGTFHSSRPPELAQNEFGCFFNFVEINFPHNPGDTFQVEEVKSTGALASLLGIYCKWCSDRRMRKRVKALQLEQPPEVPSDMSEALIRLTHNCSLKMSISSLWTQLRHHQQP